MKSGLQKIKSIQMLQNTEILSDKLDIMGLQFFFRIHLHNTAKEIGTNTKLILRYFVIIQTIDYRGVSEMF